MLNMSAVKAAYEKHPDALKGMVRYEDLRRDPLKEVARICEALRIETDDDQLAQAVKKRSWENVPEEEKGEGKFRRKASPGSWREDLTPDQARLVEEISAPCSRCSIPARRRVALARPADSPGRPHLLRLLNRSRRQYSFFQKGCGMNGATASRRRGSKITGCRWPYTSRYLPR